MSHIEHLELSAHRGDIINDVNDLIEKYQEILGWDVPDIDEGLTNALILNEVRKALDSMQAELEQKHQASKHIA
tara:strand:+ start:472 stop:693 length:222 start_codon:yes stop_codon:yes gene_type:complete